jgi:integrase
MPSLDELLERYVAAKRAAGYAYPQGSVRAYASLVRFMGGRGITRPPIDEASYHAWTAHRAHESAGTHASRVMALHGFSLFLTSLGLGTFVEVPEGLSRNSGFVPYIYTDKDIVAILRAADSLPPYRMRVFDRNAIVPVLIRLLYSTGMRISEALALRMGRIDIERRRITVVSGKNGKSRLVMPSESMAAVLRRYCDGTGRAGDGDYLFRGSDGRRLSRDSVWHWHRLVLERAGVRTAAGGYPRIHDWRHCYILGALEQMEDNGFDLYVALPMLSSYVGHCGPKETGYYLRLTERGRERMTGAIYRYAPELIPDIEGVG